MSESMTRRLLSALTALAVLLLLAKYVWTLFAFPGVPFGYDAGIYRFLFIREAAGWPPLFTPALPEWAKSHAPGLFFFTSPLVKAGLSPDLLIGWIWNLVPALLAVTLACVVRRKHGDLAGFFLLLCALVSVVQMQGFLMMYYKVFIALLFCALAFAAFESASLLWIPLGMLTIAVHQQVGLIFAVAVFSALVAKSVFTKHPTTLRQWGEWLLTLVLGLLWYLPTYQRSLGDVLPRLLGSGTVLVLTVALMAVGIFAALIVTLPRQNRRFIWILCVITAVMIAVALPLVSDAPDFVHFLFRHADTQPGAFLSILEYLRMSAPLLFLGIVGLTLSAEKERGSVWQWAALWCAVAAFGMFLFYRRFLLPMDFFLLSFAATAAAALWRNQYGRIIVAVLLIAQACFLAQQIRSADPHVEPQWLAAFAELSPHVPAGTDVVVLDNMAPWIVGYLPDARVSGPGIFDSRPYTEWEKFLLGSESDRRMFISQYAAGTFFYASPVFFAYYPPEVRSVLTHPCLAPAGPVGLYRSSCGGGDQ